MIAKKIFRPRTLVAVLAVLLIMIAAYAYAAANVVPETGAGDGSNTISGYTISNVQYSLDAANPTLISAVSFDIDPTAGASFVREVKVQLVTGGNWFDCTEAGTSATCTITGVTVLAADQFRVVAVQ
jgi:archaellin